MNPLAEAWGRMKPTVDKLQGINDQYKDFNQIQSNYGMPAALGQNVFNQMVDIPGLSMDLNNNNYLKYQPSDTNTMSNINLTLGPDIMHNNKPSGLRLGAQFNF